MARIPVPSASVPAVADREPGERPAIDRPGPELTSRRPDAIRHASGTARGAGDRVPAGLAVLSPLRGGERRAPPDIDREGDRT